ncbi:FRG domain-containing protein [Bacillus safensis]
MQNTKRNIFGIELLEQIDLSCNEKELKRIMVEYSLEIEEITQMQDDLIEKELSNFKDKETEQFEVYLKNLTYIKQSYFIMLKEPEINSNKYELEYLKDIKIEEIIDLEQELDDGKLILDYSKINNLVNRRKEEEEKWKEYNIPHTLSEMLGINKDEIIYINKLSEYIDFVSKLEPAENYVSRGQKNCTNKLIPSLHRRYTKDFEIYADKYESAFKQKIVFYDRDIIGKSKEALRAEGQHFGLPTEYLDFTEAHLISLLFAIEDYEYKEHHSIVYFIDALSYNDDTINRKEKLIDYSDTNVVDGLNKFSARSYFIKLGNSNERIHFQKGCFLKVSTQDREDFERRLFEFGKIVIINNEAKKNMLKELFNLGITFENIYPDKDNVVKSINFQHEMMKGDDI